MASALLSILDGRRVYLEGRCLSRISTPPCAIRRSNVVSIATTTGYASVDYALWPIFAPLWMLFLSSFVTSAGSTGGGIKMMRALLLYKQVFRELVRAMHPKRSL